MAHLCFFWPFRRSVGLLGAALQAKSFTVTPKVVNRRGGKVGAVHGRRESSIRVLTRCMQLEHTRVLGRLSWALSWLLREGADKRFTRTC